MFIFVLLLSCSDEKIYEKFNVPADVFKYRAVVFGLVCVYMALPLSFYAAGNIDAALKTYPVYTDAYAAKLSETQDMDEGEKIAKKLLKQNETVSLAYSALAQAACQEGKIDKVAEYEKRQSKEINLIKNSMLNIYICLMICLEIKNRRQ